MNLHVAMESYQLYTTQQQGPGPVVPPEGSGWELVSIFDQTSPGYIFFLWRRSHVYAATSPLPPATHPQAPLEGSEAPHPPSGLPVASEDLRERIQVGFHPPPSQRQRLKIPKGVFD
jgi:hypothetical protein